ncbi:MAG: hypothetical protein LRY36_02345 [Alphaproteobacteria bacterium]|nr:hypothetical protein [Alphaproteobacteria bacterium]
MSIWIFLWLAVSAALIYFSAWTGLILLRQKRAWKAFAGIHKLRFQETGLLVPPQMNGPYKGYEIALFPSEHQTTDRNGLRKLTAIEIMLKRGMPCDGAIGTGGMVSLIQELPFSQEIRPTQKWWDPSAIVKTDNAPLLEAYLSPERLKALATLGRIKNIWVIFIFKGQDTILRIDTPDPLEQTKKIEKMLALMLEAARVLELAPGEAERLKQAEKDKKSATPKLSAPSEDTEDNSMTLELEEDTPEDEETPEEEHNQDTPDESATK